MAKRHRFNRDIEDQVIKIVVDTEYLIGERNNKYANDDFQSHIDL